VRRTWSVLDRRGGRRYYLVVDSDAHLVHGRLGRVEADLELARSERCYGRDVRGRLNPHDRIGRPRRCQSVLATPVANLDGTYCANRNGLRGDDRVVKDVGVAILIANRQLNAGNVVGDGTDTT